MRLLLTGCILCFVPFISVSQEKEWVPLFNGEDLTGWRVRCVEQDRDKQFWTVSSETILCNSTGSTDHEYVWLETLEEYEDFEIKLKFQSFRGTSTNSGIQVRSRYDERANIDGNVIGWLDGPQIDLNPNEPWRNGLIYDETREHRRWIFPDLPDWNIDKNQYASSRVVHYFDDESPGWNELIIICEGTRIKTIVNGIEMADYDGSGVLDDTIHTQLDVGMSGHIALQVHKNSENYIRFKDIWIRELKR